MNYLLEPGRFRKPRGPRETAHLAPSDVVNRLYPEAVENRLFLVHTRPETLLGVLAPLHTGPRTVGLGFSNHGGTLNVHGMLFVNRATWAHCVDGATTLLGSARGDLLTDQEIAALDRRRSPEGVII